MSQPAPALEALRGRPFATLLRYNRPYARRYLVGAVLALCFGALNLALPALVRHAVAVFEAEAMTRATLALIFLGMTGAAALAGIARYHQRMLMIGASRHFEFDLRNDLFARLLTLHPAWFNKHKTGDILARATNDLNQVREFVGPGIMGSVDMVQIPFVLGMMIYLSPTLTLVALVPLPFISLLVYVFMRYMNRQSKVVQAAFGDVSAKVQENIAGARVVKAYGIGARETAEFRGLSMRYMRENVKLVAIMSTAIPILGVLVGSIVMLVVWRGGDMVITGRLALADLTAFMVCMIMLAWPLAQLGWVLTLYQRGAAGMDRISAILCETPAIRDDARTRPEARVAGGAVRFEGVAFGYGDTPVVRELDFEIPAGATVALLGPTGSGKSTVIGLLTRAHDPDAGRVLIDGIDAREHPLRALRGAIGLVPQDIFIFSDTIRNNIAMGRPGVGEAEVLRACELAQFSEALAGMPDGLDTILGERGINLSGGQKQRLTLARALAGNPKILILDDALSSVDTQTEERILQGLRGVLQGRTALLVSHRVSTVRHAARIFVLDGGRLAESGTHAELLALGGIYADMERRQRLEDNLEGAGGAEGAA